MKSNTKTLTEGPLAKQIFLVSLPLALSNLLQDVYKRQELNMTAGESPLSMKADFLLFIQMRYSPGSYTHLFWLPNAWAAC